MRWRSRVDPVEELDLARIEAGAGHEDDDARYAQREPQRLEMCDPVGGLEQIEPFDDEQKTFRASRKSLRDRVREVRSQACGIQARSNVCADDLEPIFILGQQPSRARDERITQGFVRSSVTFQAEEQTTLSGRNEYLPGKVFHDFSSF